MTTDIHRARILLIEDEQDLREDIAEELEAAGYAVTCHEHGAQALQWLEGHRPDLILCDISMPVLDGYALLDTLQCQRPDLADIPFVFLTARASIEQISHGKRAGADDYLVKPLDFDLMLATLEARLRQMHRLKRLHHPESRTAASAQFYSIQGMLDSLAINLLMFNDEGRISFLNKMAYGSFGLQIGQSLADFIQATAVRETDQLRNNILQMITSNEEAPRCLALTGINTGLQNLLATVCPLERKETSQQTLPPVQNSAQAVVSVIISSMPGQRPQPPFQLLQTLYELTPAESRVAWAFTQGQRSDEIAAQFQISPTTVAFHKRNIFRKRCISPIIVQAPWLGHRIGSA